MQVKSTLYTSPSAYDADASLVKAKSTSVFIMFNKYCLWFVLVIYLLLATPVARSFLEQSMLSHMLVQIPLLVLCGAWMINHFINKFQLRIAYHFALPLLIIALTTAMFWMLPRNLDASLEHGSFEALKFISLPLLLGATFVLGWKSSGEITKSFICTNLISMLFVLAWLYIEAPVRLCNYYLIDEQKILGESILYVAGIFSLFLIIKIFK